MNVLKSRRQFYVTQVSLSDRMQLCGNFTYNDLRTLKHRVPEVRLQYAFTCEISCCNPNDMDIAEPVFNTLDGIRQYYIVYRNEFHETVMTLLTLWLGVPCVEPMILPQGTSTRTLAGL